MPLPSEMKVAVPAGVAGQLAVYAGADGTKTLGPRSWHCKAEVGADGSQNVSVFPPAYKAGPAPEEVQVNFTGACVGCAISQACPLFSSAASDARSSPMPCTPRPAAEKVVRVNAHVVFFEDPPHVKGDGFGSGGPNPDNGVMTYYRGDIDRSWQADCTLPAADHLVCTAVLNSFVLWYGKD
jgi:hypothetical protein